MALTSVFRWQHPDSTANLNDRLEYLIQRGIYWGGAVAPGAGLTVVVQPFIGMSFDGMTVAESAAQTLTVHAGQTDYVVLRAKYNALGSPATPTLNWETMSAAAYAVDPERDYLIVFATVTLAGGAVAVLNADISLVLRDVVDPVGRDWFRGQVALPANLPTAAPIANVTGDFYYVTSELTFYFWDGAAWVPLNTGSFNSEVSLMNQHLITDEINRIVDGSGVVGGLRPSNNRDFSAETDVAIIENAAVADRMGVNSFSALVNGHFVEAYARDIAFPVKPGIGDRYDLLFLEVWREDVVTPDTWVYERNPTGAVTYTHAQMSDEVEQIQWAAGLAGDNYNLNEIVAHDHDWRVTNWRIAVAQNVPASALYNPNGAAVLAAAANVDGAAWTAPPAGADDRCWIATSAVTPADGRSWAIPLFVVRRTSAEDHTIGHAIEEFRSGVRYVFPVYPVADTRQSARKALDTVHRGSDAPYGIDHFPYDKPSGFLTSMDQEVTTGGGNAITWWDNQFKVRVRGIEDWVDFIGANISVGAAPAASYERILVYLKMSITLYAHDDGVLTGHHVSERHRPYVPSSMGNVRSQGWKRGYVTFETVVENLGAVDVRDTDAAMAAATGSWVRGDVTMAAYGAQYNDGGIWSEAIAIDEDDRIHPYETWWAIPVCLIHRRNSAAWHYSTNYNGTGVNRPDGKISPAVLTPDDIVDLRHTVDLDPSDLKSLMEADIDRAMKGTLRTRLANKWAGPVAGPTYAGSRVLQTDFIGNSGGTAYDMTAGDNTRRIWSDGKEFHLVARAFPLSVDYNDPDGLVDYTELTGELIIRSPTGAYLCRHLPASVVVDANKVNATYLHYLGPPLWSTREEFSVVAAAYPTPVEAKVINTGTNLEGALDLGSGSSDPAFAISAWDWTQGALMGTGHAVEMTGTVHSYAANDVAVLAWWVHWDRSPAAPYNINYGLAEIPDEVHSITKGPLTGTPAESNLGTLYTIVRKTVAGATTTISAADVQAASGVSGATFTLLGIANDTAGQWDPAAVYDSAPGNNITGVQINSTQDTITVTWGGAIACDVDFVVFFYTDLVDTWLEVGRGGKSVRAYFEWHEEDIDLGGVPAAAHAFSLGQDIWQHAECGGNFYTMPLVFTRAAAGVTPWDQVPLFEAPSFLEAGYPYSNVVSFTDLSVGAVVQRYVKVVVPVHKTPTSAASDVFQIDYTYTPYQGLSGTGGAKAVPATAVPRLVDMLHGKIEEVADTVATQSGACSYFGGVDGWNGWPARIPYTVQNFLDNRFNAYNQTQLVKETKANGSQDLGVNAGAAENLNCASVMRLPFPANPNMVATIGAVSYPYGTQDYDIDPGREGVSSGYFSYAPGYPSGISSTVSILDYGVVYDQFVNGMTRLSINGASKQQDMTNMVQACEFVAVEQTTPNTSEYNSVGAYWQASASDEIIVDGAIHNMRGHVPGLIATAVHINSDDDPTGYDLRLMRAGGTSAAPLWGAAPASYLTGVNTWTAPIVLLAANDTMICFCPGTIYYYYVAGSVDVYPLVHAEILASATAGTRLLGSSLVVTESARQSYHKGFLDGVPGFSVGGYTDTIRIPLGSLSASGGSGLVSYGISALTLKGRTIAYPASWVAGDVTAAEALIDESILFHASYGRGVYLGTTTVRSNMPVMVPGSGTPLGLILDDRDHLSKAAQPPDAYPFVPSESIFAPSNKRWAPFDHGGPVAYVFNTMLINPTDDDYSGRIVMQIAGGPTMGTSSGNSTQYTADAVDGTAIDAFWPTGRPLMPSGR